MSDIESVAKPNLETVAKFSMDRTIRRNRQNKLVEKQKIGGSLMKSLVRRWMY